MSATVGGPRFVVELEQEVTTRRFVAYVMLKGDEGEHERLTAVFIHENALEAQSRARAWASSLPK